MHPWMQLEPEPEPSVGDRFLGWGVGGCVRHEGVEELRESIEVGVGKWKVNLVSYISMVRTNAITWA